MLKLKKVQILGFKSFCDRTEVQLSGEGIAAIVGPNGCGKSNISDAINWVLGEQSAKSLRGLKMEDVIFAGTRDRKPTGMAEVSLTLVDPTVYDSPLTAAPEIVIDPESPDWDESAARAHAAAETEEAIAEAQPGLILNEDELAAAENAAAQAALAGDPSIDASADPQTPGAPLMAPSSGDMGGNESTSPAKDAVVLKIRRRKFNQSPTRAGEIVVTRRLFRSGESEYLLNGKICRLRDILDIFMGTGLGGETYAMIGQERIGQILSSKPLDRRGIIEEAAGITRFKTKKRLAELRLEAARQNLARVNDIFEEVTKQMASLKRQAAKAERYREIQTELRARLTVVLASRMAQQDAEHAALESQIAALAAQIDEQAASVESMDTEHSAGIHRGYELDQQVREAAQLANQSAVELERIAARTAANSDRAAELAARIEAGAADIEAAQQQLATLAAEQESHRSFLDTAVTEAASSREAAQHHQQQAQEASQSVAAAERAAEQSRYASLQLVDRVGRIRAEQAQAESTLAALDNESARLTSESEAARTELVALGQQRGQAKLSFESVTERLAGLETHITSLRTQLEARRSEERETRQRGDQLRAEMATLLGRRNSLESLIREHSYSTDTVRNLFRANAAAASASAPVGTLADFLEVDGQYESVVDEFLRDELNYIVVKNWDAADEGMRMLRTDVNGRATFLVHPNDSQANFPFAEGQASATSADIPGVVPLKNCVRVLDGFGKSLEVVLPRLREGFIALDVFTARSLALSNPQSYFLTPTGETFHNVTVTGGRPNAEGPLALKRELRDVQQKLDAVEAELSHADTHAATLQRQISELTASLDTSSDERRSAERESANSGAALRQMEAESARIERRLEEWSLAAERNRDKRTQNQDLIAARTEEAARLESERAAIETALAASQDQVANLRARREELQMAAAAAAAALAGLEERRRNAQANFDQTSRIFAGQQQRITQIEQQISAARAEMLRREEETAQLAAQHSQIAEARATAVADGARLTKESEELRTQMTALDQKLRTLRHETEALREQRADLTARAAKLASDIQHLNETALNDLAVEASVLREDATIQRIEGELLSTEEEAARALKQKLENMGPVNMMALEEYTEIQQRHVFLETQRKDLLDSIENTQQSIKEIDDVSRLKFEEAFKVINENFSNTFTKLFGGGQASMRLTDAENANESGIDILASPPGKKLQNILLLSGGEKALTALSLLVGIFQFQPAPFCVLDEVDAPLDETNVGRFANLIEEMSSTTQFIVITHSKRTMQQADVIYGVTMQEPGVSKIVSVNLGQGNRNHQNRPAA